MAEARFGSTPVLRQQRQGGPHLGVKQTEQVEKRTHAGARECQMGRERVW